HGAVPGRRGFGPRPVQDRAPAGDRLSGAVQGRRVAGAVREIAHITMQITAAVARERFGRFTIETLDLADPRPDELLVRVVASGMCQTDQHGRDGYYDTPLPAVFGHEGAGVVQAVGKNVTAFAPGDHVVMSYPWCGTCPNCRRHMESHCQKSFGLKM